MKITVKTAARIMEKGEMFIRIGLQRNLLPFGLAVQKNPQKRRCKYDYYINPKEFAEYLGLSREELEKEVMRMSLPNN